MCAQCAMVAVAGASGARAWLASRLPRRELKVVSVLLVVAALVVSAIGFA